MIELKPIQLSDKEWIQKITREENSRSADFNFANIFMWDASYHQAVGCFDNRFLVKPQYAKHPFFAFPVGTGDLKQVVLELRSYAKEYCFPFRIRGITEKHKKELTALFPSRFRIMEERAYFDYIYSAERLATLSGKKLHSKRNHINRFVELGDWSFEPMTRENIPECIDMLARWTIMNPNSRERGLVTEHGAILRAFEHFEALDLDGGVLRLDGRVIAFTAGKVLSSDTYDVNFEKAYPTIQGAYPMINREFIRMVMDLHPEIVYINREDDMGQENLRKAKLSYYPEFLLKKYTATWIR